MCGIFCGILNENGTEALQKELHKILQNRGPNATSLMRVGNVMMAGFVLWQQGTELRQQPVERDNIVLLLNGDAFMDDVKPAHLDDTAWLAECLSNCKNEAELCAFFRTLHGPFSLIFFQRDTEQLYFCRDSLGRNSLLLERNPEGLQILSSSFYNCKSVDQSKIMELPPLGLYKLDTKNPNICTIFPWKALNEEAQIQVKHIEKMFGMTVTIGQSINPAWLNLDDSIDEHPFDFYRMAYTTDATFTQPFDSLLTNKEILQAVENFSLLLENSVRYRVEKTPKFCKNCLEKLSVACNHSKIAVLFSGGIDCSILALLVDKYVEKEDSIDLINVAFEQANSKDCNWNVPDRCSARDSLVELQRLCPERNWNFVEVNVSRGELQETLKSHIRHLIYPLDTVLDESIGCAFWFASRGRGICNTSSYESPARVVIVGSGADELFGGYVRHRNAYQRCHGIESEKQSNVLAELEKDWQRIPSRNLARDDRVIADNGKTSRAPFIEENVVQYVRSLKPSQRCCFLLEEGVGDKLFLRLYGHLLGLKMATSLKKRAIQFGSRIANKKQNAAHQSEYLKFNKSSAVIGENL